MGSSYILDSECVWVLTPRETHVLFELRSNGNFDNIQFLCFVELVPFTVGNKTFALRSRFFSLLGSALRRRTIFGNGSAFACLLFRVLCVSLDQNGDFEGIQLLRFAEVVPFTVAAFPFQEYKIS